MNYFLFPLAIVFFFGYQLAVAAILFFYSRFDTVQAGKDDDFESFSSFWLVLGLLHLLAFASIFLKNFLTEIVLLMSGEKIHEDMVMGIVRSPLSYFDVTPSGQITNKFSNDLGILDNEVAPALVYVL